LQDTTNKTHYKIGISTKQLETFTKNGLLFPGKPWKSIAIMTTERFHRQEMNFGNKKYSGEQKSLYVNTIWQDIIDNTNNKIKFGTSLIADNFKEKFTDAIPKKDSIYDSQNIVPGGYFEYTYTNDTNFSAVAGIREDFLKEYGWMASPRLHIKYNPDRSSVFRLSGGRGFRTPHIFAENSSVFASSREVVIQDNLKPEIAWNYGMALTEKFQVTGRQASINIDFFRTDFQSQVVVDLEDANKVQFYGLKGKSYSNAFQTDFSFEPFERLNIHLAYKHYDVKETYNGMLLDKPLVPKDRALLNIDYATNLDKWKFDFTLKWFGESRLPNTSANPAKFQLPATSLPYYTLMGQITKRFRWFEIYLGGENLLDYRIPNPIVDPENPFGSNFDASMIWGPVTGRVIYGGFRYKIL
jgi:outer membrane receptor for ferrienterochelin and colicin